LLQNVDHQPDQTNDENEPEFDFLESVAIPSHVEHLTADNNQENQWMSDFDQNDQESFEFDF
jgi:hypothetical protein